MSDMPAEFRYERPAETGEPLGRVVLRYTEDGFLFFCVLLLSGFATFLLIGNNAETTPDASAIARSIWYPMYLGIAVVVGLRITDFAQTLPRLLLIWLLLGLSAASVLWTYEPELTTRRTIALGFTVLFGLYLALRRDWTTTLVIVGSAWMLLAVINLLMIVAVPSMGLDVAPYEGAWRGFTVQKNQLGGEMARANLIFCALFYAHPPGRKVWGAGILLTFALVIGSQSTTALLTLIIPYGLFVLYMIGRRSPAYALATLYLGVVGAGTFAAALVLIPEQMAGLIGKDITLTGRTDIWAESVTSIMERPWTGYGLGAFWDDPMGPSYMMREVLEWVVPSAHNAWIEVGLALGLPGLALMAAMTLFALVRLGLRAMQQDDPWPLIIMVQIVIFTLSESILWAQNTFVSALHVALLAYAFLPADYWRPRAEA